MVQVDHLCSLPSPSRPWLSVPWPAFAVKSNRVIPAVKASHYRFTLFSSHSEHHHALKFIFCLVKGVQVPSGFHQWPKLTEAERQIGNKNEASWTGKCRQNGYVLYMLMCIVGKRQEQNGPFFGIKDNTLKRPICLIEFRQPKYIKTHTHAPY